MSWGERKDHCLHSTVVANPSPRAWQTSVLCLIQKPLFEFARSKSTVWCPFFLALKDWHLGKCCRRVAWDMSNWFWLFFCKLTQHGPHLASKRKGWHWWHYAHLRRWICAFVLRLMEGRHFCRVQPIKTYKDDQRSTWREVWGECSRCHSHFCHI